MNLPNLISLSRLLFSMLFMGIFYIPSSLQLNPSIEIGLLVLLFGVSEFTDFLDGYISRKKKIVSQLGKLLDPFTDTIAHITFLFCFFTIDIVPLYLILIVIYRELGAVFLRLLFQIKGVTQPAQLIGKVKSVFYAISIGFALFYYASLLYQNPFGDLYTAIMNLVFVLTAILSVLSFLQHFWIYIKTPNRSA